MPKPAKSKIRRKIAHDKNIGHLIGHVAYIALYIVLIVLAITLYNSAYLVELQNLGWVALALGIIFILWSSQSRKKGRIKEGSKDSFVEIGMYTYIRHPEFLGHILVISALVVISQHWASLIVGAILITLICLAMIEEEKRNIEKFGNAYRDYMKRVPRINLLIGVIRRVRRNEEDISGVGNDC